MSDQLDRYKIRYTCDGCKGMCYWLMEHVTSQIDHCIAIAQITVSRCASCLLCLHNTFHSWLLLQFCWKFASIILRGV